MTWEACVLLSEGVRRSLSVVNSLHAGCSSDGRGWASERSLNEDCTLLAGLGTEDRDSRDDDIVHGDEDSSDQQDSLTPTEEEEEGQ